MEQMKVGVIGIGTMGINHARVYSEIADLIAVSDTDTKRLAIARERFGVETFEDHEKLLESGVQAITVATPTVTHYQLAKEAIQRGIHVLVEKPITDNIESAKALCDLAAEHDATLAVGHIERHNPVVGAAKRDLETGKFGDAISISARRVSSFPRRIKDVGVIFDIGIHDIDVIRYLADAEVEKVFALGGRINHPKFEDHANILLEFDNGITGMVDCNWLTPMKVRKLSLTCSEKFIELDYIAQRLKISSSHLDSYHEEDLSSMPWENDTHEIALHRQEPLKNELRDFLHAIIEGVDPLVTGDDGLRAIEVAAAATKSCRDGTAVIVSDH